MATTRSNTDSLPAGGRLVTLEVDPRHAETARANLVRAGLAEVVELRLGPALETLPQLIAEKGGPFDLIFIDADKGAIPEYFARALELSRRGTMIIVDNVVRNGAVADPASTDPAVLGVRRFHQLLAVEKRVRLCCDPRWGGAILFLLAVYWIGRKWAGLV